MKTLGLPNFNNPSDNLESDKLNLWSNAGILSKTSLTNTSLPYHMSCQNIVWGVKSGQDCIQIKHIFIILKHFFVNQVTIKEHIL